MLAAQTLHGQLPFTVSIFGKGVGTSFSPSCVAVSFPAGGDFALPSLP